MLLHNKYTLVREGSGYPRNGMPMGVFALALAHLTITHTKQLIAKLDFISYLIYNAISPFGGYLDPWLLSNFVYGKGNMMHFGDLASSCQEFSWQWVN